ncbi:unnamed protein product [Rhodiola kirilowii]
MWWIVSLVNRPRDVRILWYLLELWELSSLISSISNTWNYIATILEGKFLKSWVCKRI